MLGRAGTLRDKGQKTQRSLNLLASYGEAWLGKVHLDALVGCALAEGPHPVAFLSNGPKGVPLSLGDK